MNRLTGARALLRIAAREALRAKARTALVALLVALPVAGAGAVDVVWRATVLEARDVVQLELAGAQARVEMVAGGPVTQTATAIAAYPPESSAEPIGPVTRQLTALAGAVPPGDRFVAAPSWSVDSVRGRDGGSSATLWQLPFSTEPALAGLVEQLRGRAPTRPTEVVLSAGLAENLGTDVGGEISVPGERVGTRRSLTVVGVVRITPRFDGGDVVLGVGGLIPPAVLTAPDPRIPGTGRPVATGWVVGPVPMDRARVEPFSRMGAIVISRPVILADYTPEPGQAPATEWASKYPDQAVIASVAAGLVLLQIVLMAGPALAVGARRQQRTLALLGAGGATRSQMRGLVLANGLVAGLVAGAAGAAAGVGLGAVAVQWARTHQDLAAPRLDVRVTDLALLLATAVVTTVAAALVPARQAARMDVVGALTGRRPAARRQRARTALGLLFVASGLAGALVAAARHEPAPTVVGIAVAEVGFVLLVPAVVALAARLTVTAAPTLRMSLRDADRQRTRTAPAVAAVMAAVAAAVASMTFAATQSDRTEASRQWLEPPRVASVQDTLQFVERGHPDRDDPSRTVPGFDPARIAARLGEALPVRSTALSFTVLDRAGDDARLAALTAPGFPCEGVGQETIYLPNECQDLGGRTVFTFPEGTLVGDADALAAFTGAASQPVAEASQALRAGKIVVARPSLIWPDGSVHLLVLGYHQGDWTTERTVIRPGYLWRSSPALADPVISPATLRTDGLALRPGRLIARLSDDVDEADVQRAEAALRRDGDATLTVTWDYPDGQTPTLLWAILAAAVAVALLGTFSAVGLAAAEARPDLSTLAAVGASPGLRRRFAAAQAVTVAGLGSAVGLLAGLATGYVFARLLMHPMRSWSDVLVDTEGARWGHTWGLHVPWLPVTAFVVGLPLLTAAVMATLTRSRLHVVRRLGQ